MGPNPDLSRVETAAETPARELAPGATVILESTTYLAREAWMKSVDLCHHATEVVHDIAASPIDDRDCLDQPVLV